MNQRWTEGDEALVRAAETGEGAIPIESTEQLMDLARMAKETKDAFDDDVASMREEQARFTRWLRVDEGCSWRAVAARYEEQYGDETGGNQLKGMALCEKAAPFFGEDPNEDPWN